MKKNNINFNSTCVHAGFEAETHKAHVTPIYATTTFLFDDVAYAADLFTGKQEGYIYSRWGNPTITQVEDKIAALETWNVKDNSNNNLQVRAILHSSGLAAFNTLFLGLLKHGDTLLSHYSLYGGTQEILDKILPNSGINVIHNAMLDLQEFEDVIKNNSTIKLVHIESPANPTLTCVDIKSICTIANKYHIKVSVDNTFATPYLQQPFALGADFILHSSTKFLNGHGTGISGVLLGKDIELMNGKLLKQHRLMGANSNAFDAFLLSNGIKTLGVRMERHCSNAKEVATFLDKHPSIAFVNYLGLPSHASYNIAQLQMRNPGALLSCELKGGLQAGTKFINNLKLCTHATSLGTCDTLISHPASTTHYGVFAELRQKGGITDGLIRISVGLEDAIDIIADIEQALNK